MSGYRIDPDEAAEYLKTECGWGRWEAADAITDLPHDPDLHMSGEVFEQFLIEEAGHSEQEAERVIYVLGKAAENVA